MNWVEHVTPLGNKRNVYKNLLGKHERRKPQLRLYSFEHTLLPTRLLSLMHVKHTVPYLYIQPFSWRWTLGLETRRKHQKL